MLEDKDGPDDSFPVQQVRELYKACTATGRNLMILGVTLRIMIFYAVLLLL
jgi:hypothetical protein